MTENKTNTKEEAAEVTKSASVPDAIETKVNTDGRKPYEWQSKYPKEARNEMLWEAIYIGAVLVVSFLGLFLNWSGVFSCFLKVDPTRVIAFEGILLYFLSGLMGGTIFGIKYFYRVVARGYWTQDRKYWRVFSPWISACVALVVGCMIVSGYINATQTPSTATGVCVGFISGYFADEAVGKMSEVATALFGSSSKVK
ncbi:MAG: hypothetical protein J6M56_11970 [Clostridia bacterium]|nr:hypothetical protein [Clostridia bacterium]